MSVREPEARVCVYMCTHMYIYIHKYLRGVISVREPEARIRDVAGKVGIFLFCFDVIIKHLNISLHFILY